MKLKLVVQILIGIVVTYTAVALIKGENVILIPPSILMLMFIHELLHLVPIKMFRLKYKLLINGLYIGFKTTFNNVNQLIVVAIAPQIITLIFMLFYIVTLNASALALAILHIAISCEDLAKITKYLINYFI